MKRFAIFCVVFSAFALTSHAGVAPLSSIGVQVSDPVIGYSNFAADFHKQCAQSQSGNVIVSPYSVSSALTLLSQAANGNTYDQLKRGLYLNGDKTSVANHYLSHLNSLQRSVGGAVLSNANKVYVKQGYQLNRNFQQTAVAKFSSGVEAVNFANKDESAGTINRFVEEKTNGKIQNLVKPDMFNAGSRVVLINAVYMKGAWQNPFSNWSTTDGNAYDETGTHTVKFMNEVDYYDYAVLPDLDATALGMRYAESQLSFVIVLPNSNTGLDTLESKLKNDDFSKISEAMRNQKVDVKVPKFKVEFEINLNDALKNMGMAEMFDEEKANLSDLLEVNEKLYVSDVIHKAFLSIDEKGSEAAAATAVLMMVGSAGPGYNPPPPPKFHADHPFVFYIWDNQSKTVIFSGRIKKFNF